jgi:hypothetical protein
VGERRREVVRRSELEAAQYAERWMRPLRAARRVRARRGELCLSEALRSLRSRMGRRGGHVCSLICLCVRACLRVRGHVSQPVRLGA